MAAGTQRVGSPSGVCEHTDRRGALLGTLTGIGMINLKTV